MDKATSDKIELPRCNMISNPFIKAAKKKKKKGAKKRWLSLLRLSMVFYKLSIDFNSTLSMLNMKQNIPFWMFSNKKFLKKYEYLSDK